MITRQEIISKAVEECLQELYKYAQPHIEWDVFLSENKKYSSDYIMWKEYNKIFKEREKYPEKWKTMKELFPNWENKSIIECIGPRPYEFYYLPRNILEEVVNNFVYAYELDQHQQLLDTIHILKNYCEDPIVKHIKKEENQPEYDHPDNLKTEVTKLLNMYFHNSDCDLFVIAEDIEKIFFEFLNMAEKFYNWNGELNSFNTGVYLGISPNTNKQAVIDNWKKYRNQTIEINDNEYDNEEQDFD